MTTNVATTADLEPTSAEKVKLAKLRETLARVAQYEAQAQAEQAKADRLRAEGADEQIVKGYEEDADRAWRTARELRTRYEELALGRRS